VDSSRQTSTSTICQLSMTIKVHRSTNFYSLALTLARKHSMFQRVAKLLRDEKHIHTHIPTHTYWSIIFLSENNEVDLSFSFFIGILA